VSEFIELVKLSMRPATIIYPYPILPLLIFSHSGTYNILSLFKAIIFSFIFYSGVNLWNHVNDIEEDVLGGKRNIIIENVRVRKLVSIISPIQYLTSFSLTILWCTDWRGIVAFAVAAFATWIYSDRIVLGRIVRRWKDYYLTEVLAFVIFFPLFTLALWTFFTPLSAKSVALSTAVSFFLLSGTFLKDIKDITGDKLAGLKTLGVVFSPETLLKASLTMLFLYYISILIFTLFKIFPSLTLASVVFSAGAIHTTVHFINNDWQITIREAKVLESMFYFNISSFMVFIISGFM